MNFAAVAKKNKCVACSPDRPSVYLLTPTPTPPHPWNSRVFASLSELSLTPGVCMCVRVCLRVRVCVCTRALTCTRMHGRMRMVYGYANLNANTPLQEELQAALAPFKDEKYAVVLDHSRPAILVGWG